METPYVAVIFSAQRDIAVSEDDYQAAVRAMRSLAATQPGYLGIESARDPDGFGITVSYWRTEDNARAWKAVSEHREAQLEGRSRWYTSYELRVATVTRAYGFDRETDGAPRRIRKNGMT